MEKFDWKTPIKINILKLKAVGLWPHKTYKLNLYTLWAAISFICIISAHNIFQAINIIFLLDDLKAVTSIIFLNLSELLGMLKAYYLFRNMAILKQLMLTLNSDIFQPKNQQQQELIEPNLKLWRLNYVVYWGMSLGAVFFWIAVPVLDKSVKNWQLPFSAWYPFDTKVSPNYEITYLYQAIGVIFVAISTLGVDTLIAALTMYIGAQLDLLCDNLKHLRSKNFEAEFFKCIEHHKQMLEWVQKFWFLCILVVVGLQITLLNFLTGLCFFNFL